MVDGVIERYLQALVAGDWSTFAECLADDGFTRVGPYGDTYSSKPEYIAFLSELMPTLAEYEMAVARVTYAGDGMAFAELSETVTVDGTALRTPECLAFELEGDRIRRVEVFTQSRFPV